MKKTTQLNGLELQRLSKLFRELESYTLKSTGYNRVSGGYAVANHFDYDDDIIDVELKFGSQSDVDDYSTTEQYKVCRKTFKIIN